MVKAGLNCAFECPTVGRCLFLAELIVDTDEYVSFQVFSLSFLKLQVKYAMLICKRLMTFETYSNLGFKDVEMQILCIGFKITITATLYNYVTLCTKKYFAL